MNYKICKKCICDNSINEIAFDQNEVCTYCNIYLPLLKKEKKTKIYLNLKNKLKK